MTSKGGHDPGWNDPPVFTYDKATAIQAAAANKKGVSLNKRVAFPIGSNSENLPKKVESVGLGISERPSGFQPPPLSSFPCVKSEPTPATETEISSKERLNIVLQNFQVETDKDEEIIKRISIMKKMWTEGKLEEKVQLRVFELSEALSKNDPDTADHIQKGLMVDYVSQCSSWMSGIRHLINKKKVIKSIDEHLK